MATSGVIPSDLSANMEPYAHDFGVPAGFRRLLGRRLPYLLSAAETEDVEVPGQNALYLE